LVQRRGSTGYASRVTDTEAPGNQDLCLQNNYPIGFASNGVEPSTTHTTLGGNRQVYWGFFIRISDPWHGHEDSGVNKMMFQWWGGGDIIYLAFRNDGKCFAALELSTEFSNIETTMNDISILDGAWHKVQWYMNADTGVVRFWVDDELQGERTDVPFTGGMATAVAEHCPTWGGTTGPSKASADWQRINQIYISEAA